MSLKNILCREKVLRVFVDETQCFLYALAILILGLELICYFQKDSFTIQRDFFVACVCGFYLFSCALEYVFRIFLKNRAVSLLSLLPGVLLFILLNVIFGPSVITYGLLASVILRLFLCYVPGRKKLFTFACFGFDVMALLLRFVGHMLVENHSTDKALFISLVVLSLYSLQKLIFDQKKEGFPFHFFILIAVILAFLPVGEKPIDWSFVEDFARRVSAASENALYSLDGILPGGSYSTGYSSFSVKGGKLKKSSKPQLLLSITDYPYHTYVDGDSGVKKMVKKTIYLPGSKGEDKSWLCNYLSLLFANGVDSERAALFSKVSKMDVEYVYLNTKDEILPEGCLYYTCGGKSSSGDEISYEGKSEDSTEEDALHKKGFSLSAVYLDIDYGSPYLTELFEHTESVSMLSYGEASSYMEALYGLSLSDVLSKDEYDEALKQEIAESDLDTTGTNEKEMELATEITVDAKSDYEKCLAVESYLRQFSYSTNALGGYQSDSSLASASGMADIADRFLFETKEGYCVHYTAAMVTLLRLNHIPARPVMGYHYDFPYKVQKDYTVTSDCAHAWPEAYIENVGWVTFEPTGAYPSAAFRSWKKSAVGDAISLETKEAEVEEVESTKSTDKKTVGLHILTIVGIVLGSIVLLIALIVFGTIFFRKLRYHFADDSQRVKMDVEQIKKILVKHSMVEQKTMKNLSINNSSTGINDRGLLYDYLLYAPIEERDSLKKAFDLYYKSVYATGSAASITAEEALFVREVYERQLKLR